MFRQDTRIHARTHARKQTHTYDLSAITVPLQEAHERELALLFDESASRNSELEHKATTLELCNLRLVDDLSALAISQVHERQSICVIYARSLICTYIFSHTHTHAYMWIYPSTQCTSHNEIYVCAGVYIDVDMYAFPSYATRLPSPPRA